MPPLEQRNWCLPEGLFQANILLLEKYSQCCPTRNLKAEVDFSIIFFFLLLCFEKSLCSSSRRLSRQPAQEGYWDPGHGNRECFRCRLVNRSRKAPFFTDFPSACSTSSGLRSCPACQQQQLEHSLGFAARGNRPVMI